MPCPKRRVISRHTVEDEMKNEVGRWVDIENENENANENGM